MHAFSHKDQILLEKPDSFSLLTLNSFDKLSTENGRGNLN